MVRQASQIGVQIGNFHNFSENSSNNDNISSSPTKAASVRGEKSISNLLVNTKAGVKMPRGSITSADSTYGYGMTHGQPNGNGTDDK